MKKNVNVMVEVGDVTSRVVPGDVAAVLEPVLTYAETRFEAGGPLGHRRVSHRERLYRADGDGGLLIPSGLVARVQRTLTAAGLNVTVHDRRTTPSRVKPDAEALRQLDGDAIAKAALVCRLFPKARVMVRLPGRDEVRRFRRRLQDELGDPVHDVEHYDWPEEGGRLVATTHRSTDPRPLDSEVVLYADALKAVAPGYMKSVLRLKGQRVYGFVPHGAAMSTAARLRAEVLFGPFIFKTPDPHGVEATVRVAWCQPDTRVDSIKILRQSFSHGRRF